MKRFAEGQKVIAKDFCGKPELGGSDLDDLTVVSRKRDIAVFADSAGKEFPLRVHEARDWEWALHCPATMIKPQ